MVQGTASSAGKSLMTAALCRIISNDGHSVAPFKSQNMSLNSFVTMEGLEMGRAQVFQAQASRVEPSSDMNPILLKPTSDRKSQVIIKGRPYMNMDAAEYYAYKPVLADMIGDTFRSLEGRYGNVVIEGAGSPAEINLSDNDIVNMGMARIADAPVLLVADIDRGGVFASIYGTIMLLPEEDRARVKGILINKFRGDKEILRSGLEMIENLVGIPVMGVVPYISVKIDEEDGTSDLVGTSNGSIKVSVVRLPRISNFTDFDAFKFDEDVSLSFITSPEEIGDSDILIIPGSKNTIEDLRWLRRAGFEEAIGKFKGILFGVCGGYQMMGSEIIDVEGWEVEKGEVEKGLGIFGTVTAFEGDKITTNVEGEAAGCRVYGYEIHSGKTYGNKDPFVHVLRKQGKEEDYLDGDRIGDRYYGSYLHGIFDSNEFRSSLLNEVRKKKNLEEKEGIDLRGKREEELEKLSSVVRENIDMDYVYSLLGIKR
jgi:adenosylcobyric acid synthase